jgi:hypothetical protein
VRPRWAPALACAWRRPGSWGRTAGA